MLLPSPPGQEQRGGGSRRISLLLAEGESGVSCPIRMHAELPNMQALPGVAIGAEWAKAEWKIDPVSASCRFRRLHFLSIIY